MISKVLRIENVGKFYRCDGSDNSLAWRPNTFILAPNASGKSTLVAILRSLGESNPSQITGRKTLGAQNDPRVVLRVGSENVVFENGAWSRSVQNLHFFDVPYVHANILSHGIDLSHKKGIHKLIIGAEGARLAAEHADLKTRERAKTRERSTYESEFRSGGIRNHEIDEFLAIAQDEESQVGPRIEALKRDLQMKKSEEEIKGLKPPVSLGLIDLDLERLMELGSTTLASQHEEAEQLVLAHIEKNFTEPGRARSFLQEGTELTKADCPYCGQDLRPAAEMIAAYREYFDTQMQTFQRDLAQETETLRSWNIENALTALVATHNANSTALTQWQPHIGEQDLPEVEAQASEFLPRINDARDDLLAGLESKLSDPSVTCDMGLFSALTGVIDEVNAFVAEYNVSVAAIEALATKHVEELPESEVAEILERLGRDSEIEARFTEMWVTWATNISSTRSQTDDLTAAKTAKGDELEAYSSTIFAEYQERLNQLLARLGADFLIADLTGRTDERSSESYSDFGFLILERQVPISARSDDSPSLKNTLSEGDKSTLAFAFFIASLERHPDLSQQVIVLDDPLSSLDETRREATCAVLHGLAPRVAQICVLTHKRDFFYMLCDKFSEITTLYIRSDTANGSRIESLDVAAERRSRLQILIDRLERYANDDFGPTPEQIQGDAVLKNTLELK